MKHLKEQEWYESFYDKLTVQFAREDLASFWKLHGELKKKSSKKDFKHQGTVFLLDKFAEMTVFWQCLDRWEKRSRETDRTTRDSAPLVRPVPQN